MIHQMDLGLLLLNWRILRPGAGQIGAPAAAPHHAHETGSVTHMGHLSGRLAGFFDSFTTTSLIVVVFLLY